MSETMKDVMSKAEVRAKLQALGLTYQQVADAIGRDIRTVQRAASPASELQPSPELVEYLAEKWAMHLRQSQTVADAIDEQTELHGAAPQRVELTAYINDAALHEAGHEGLTVKEHDALLAHTMMVLDRAGIRYSVHYQPMLM